MSLSSTFAAIVFSVVMASAAAPAPHPQTATQAAGAAASDEGPPAPAGLFTSAPPGPADQIRYDAAIRASARAAEGLQGPLEGGWVLADRSGRRLYFFQIADRGLGPTTLEGAWSDLRRRGPGPHDGYLSSIVHDAGWLVILFETPGGKAPAVVTLRPAGQAWRGVLRQDHGPMRVTLRPAGR